MAVALPGVILLAVGSVSVIAGTAGGLYWVVAAVVASILAASVNAWVLLVEILR